MAEIEGEAAAGGLLALARTIPERSSAAARHDASSVFFIPVLMVVSKKDDCDSPITTDKFLARQRNP